MPDIMQVVFLLNNDYQFDNRVRREAISLVQAGHQVTVLCVQNTENGLPNREIQSGVQIRRVFPKALQTFTPFSWRHLRSAGWALMTLHGLTVEVIHAHDANMLMLGWVLSRILKTKLVYDAHELWPSVFDYHIAGLSEQTGNQSGLQSEIRKTRQAAQFENWLLPKCDAVISVNDSLCRNLRSRIVPDEAHPPVPVVPIRNIIDYFDVPTPSPKRFHEHFNLHDKDQVILYQGDIKPPRGIEILLEMMTYLPEPDLKLVLMGPCPDHSFEQTLHRRIEEHPALAGRVFLKEPVTRDALLFWTASADLGIAPILNVRESYYYCLPNKLFEYIQAEVPCATSNFPEIDNIVSGYRVGFTFDPTDPRTMAHRVSAFFQRLEQEPAYRLQLQQALSTAKQELCWENEAPHLLSLYQELGGH